ARFRMPRSWSWASRPLALHGRGVYHLVHVPDGTDGGGFAMKRRNIQVIQHTDAPPEVVFGLLADGATWPAWSPIEPFELDRPGDPPPEGPGAIRVLRMGRTTGRDQLLAVEPARRLQYASLSGLPVRDYVGEVVLERSPGGGTTIDWHSTFF